MRRLLVNDMLSALPGHRTFWNDLQDWLSMEFIGADFSILARDADQAVFNGAGSDLIIRNASYFPPLKASAAIPTISLLQDIFTEGPMREMQREVIRSSRAVVFNSEFTMNQYESILLAALASDTTDYDGKVIPLPVDFKLFEPGSPMGLQQALSLPADCICWVGASQGAAGHIKGWDIFVQIVRTNPDLHFIAVLKDMAPDVVPPNLRCYARLPQEELAKVMGACRIGLCTSRMESQHLSGIEMGACGLPMIAPPVGIYWNRNLPGMLLKDPSVEAYIAAIRAELHRDYHPELVREIWKKEFDRPVIKAQWKKLVEEVECSGQS